MRLNGLFLIASLSLALVPPAGAYEFPFNVVKFNPSFSTTLGRLVDVKAVPGAGDAAELAAFAAGCDRMLSAALDALGVAHPPRRVKAYLYANREQKRRLTGNARDSHIEDGAVHFVWRGPDVPPGDLVPLALDRAVGRSDAPLLNAGLRFLHEPIILPSAREANRRGRIDDTNLDVDAVPAPSGIPPLPVADADSLEVEVAFAEFGLHRPLRDLLRADRDAQPLDPRAMVTARGFVRFLLDRYGPEFLLALYPGERGFLKRFEKVYGFPLEDAERQWLGSLMRSPLPDRRYLEYRDRFERLGYKTLR